jgi:hypothetical protein
VSRIPRFRTVEISAPRFESGGLRQIAVKSQSQRGRGDLTLFVPPCAEETLKLLP